VCSRPAPALPVHAPHTFLPSSTSTASTTPEQFLLHSPLCARSRATAPRLPSRAAGLPPLAPSHACRAPHPPGPSSPGPLPHRPCRDLVPPASATGLRAKPPRALRHSARLLPRTAWATAALGFARAWPRAAPAPPAPLPPAEPRLIRPRPARLCARRAHAPAPCAGPARRARLLPRLLCRLHTRSAQRLMEKRKGKRDFTKHAPVGKEKEQRRQDKEEERRKIDGLPQGLIRNYRKLQGLVCKTKFSIDLKPK
jgi:hypothetical protein